MTTTDLTPAERRALQKRAWRDAPRTVRARQGSARCVLAGTVVKPITELSDEELTAFVAQYPQRGRAAPETPAYVIPTPVATPEPVAWAGLPLPAPEPEPAPPPPPIAATCEDYPTPRYGLRELDHDGFLHHAAVAAEIVEEEEKTTQRPVPPPAKKRTKK